jgi:nitroreductase
MTFEELITKNRSYRRFHEDEKVNPGTIKELIGYARLSASSGNIQGLKFFMSTDHASNDRIFKHLKWAYYFKDWDGPVPGERPTAYIVILGDTDIHSTIDIDVGIAAQSILLGATSFGLGGCMFGSIDRLGLRKSFNIPKKLQIALVIALGKPKESVKIDEVDSSGNIEYWRDENRTHHVPKRKLDDLLVHFD